MKMKAGLMLVVFTWFLAMPSGVNIARADEAKPPQIEIIGDSIYIDGEKFFIKGIGYSPFRPGEYPRPDISLKTVEADFRKIKQAGFNTLRVWGIMPEEQIRLAQKYDLKVIQGVNLGSNADFGYSGFRRLAKSRVRQACRVSKNHPNVIMYLLMNEPHADAVLNSGVGTTTDFYRELIGIVRKEDPNRPVSMANAYWTLWLDQSMWDVVSFNTYGYSPAVTDIGYANFIRNLKAVHARHKPFLVTEFGYSVSPEGPGKGGYGGNTQEEQAAGIVKCFRGLVEAGAAGGCVFEWNDEWWKAGNPLIHDGQAEEWFGILGIESRDNREGTPRKAYYRLQDEFKLVVTEPKNGQRALRNAEIEVSASPVITAVLYKIDQGRWTRLAKFGEWWRGGMELSDKEPGPHVLTVRGRENGKNIERKIDIIKCRNGEEASPAFAIEITPDKPSYENGDIMKVSARLTDRKGAPLKKKEVAMGVYNLPGNYNRTWEGRTNDAGYFSQSAPVIGRLDEWYYAYWAAAKTDDRGFEETVADMGYVPAKIGEGFPRRWLIAKKAKGISIDGIMEDAWREAGAAALSADTNFLEGDIEGPADLNARIRALWDGGNLYLLADVKDDVPLKNNYEKQDLWKGDCVELFISVKPADIPDTGYANSDFQILIGTNGKMWVTGQAQGGIRNGRPVLSKAAAQRTEGGYILEAKISIANFWEKPPRAFDKDDIIGFDVAIGDADDNRVRQSKLVWNGTAEGYKDSAVWGRLKLE